MRIGWGIKRGKGITGEILSFTRQTPVIRKPIALQEWLADLAGEARAVLGPAIDLRVDGGEGLVIAGDAAHLQQVFLNLMTNARDAMAGAGTLALEVRHGAGSGVFSFGAVENIEGLAHLTVTDSGAGISAKALGPLLRPPFTTQHSGARPGLALSRRIVEQPDDRIFVAH